MFVQDDNNFANYLISGSFSGKGLPDVIAVLPGFMGAGSKLYHYKNNLDGTLSNPAVLYAGAPGGGRQAAVGDFNGDGALDLALAGSNAASGISVFINNGSGTFPTNASVINTLTPCNSITTMDVDNDGDLDLIVSHPIGRISIVRNNGTGGFTLTQPADFEISTGSTSANHLASADFDNDGITDLAVGVTNGISLMPGTSKTLTPGTVIPLAGTPRTIVAGDMNADRFADLAAILPAEKKLVTLVNDGENGYKQAMEIDIDTTPWGLSMEDFDKDGDLDLLLVTDNGSMKYYNNDGEGQYTLSASISPAGLAIDSTATVADLNGDGFPDIVSGGSQVQTGATKYRFTLFNRQNRMMAGGAELSALTIAPTSTSVIDPATATVSLSSPAPGGGAIILLTNGNGCASLPASVQIPSGKTSAEFTITPTSNCEDSSILIGASYRGAHKVARLYVLPIMPNTVSITPAGVMGGETASVTVTLNAPAKAGGITVNLTTGSAKVILPFSIVTIPENKSSTKFTITTKAVSALTDVSITASTLKGSASGTVSLSPVPGSISFDTPVTIAAHNGYSLVSGDFNKDTKPDLAYTPLGHLYVTSGNGDGTFATAPPLPVADAKYVAKGDFNKDGFMDIAVLSSAIPSVVSIFTNNTSGGYLDKTDYPLAVNYSGGILVADFNNDGSPDIAVANSSGSTSISLLINNGSGSFSNGISPTVTFFNPNAIAAGDFNGDGIIDISAIRNTDMYLFIANSDDGIHGNGTFEASGHIVLSSSNGYPWVFRMEAGDLNNDGISDLVLGCHLANGANSFKELRIYMADGVGGLIPSGSIDLIMDNPLDPNWTIPVTIADLNGDGSLDIAAAYSQYTSAGHMSVALNNGSGLFSAPFNYNAYIRPSGITAGDFDSDGDVDIAIIHENGFNVLLYKNLQFMPPSDLTISMSDAPDPVVAGSNITYSITITNNGPNPAKSVIVSDTLPPGASFVSAVASQGICNQTTGIITCTIGDMANASTVTASIVVSTSVDGGTISNTVSVASSSPDPDSGNNSITASATSVPYADLSMSMTDSPDPIVGGENLTYSISITNSGASSAASVSVADTLPVGMLLISATPSVGSCNNTGSSITCAIGTLASGSTETVSIIASTPLTGGSLSNTATVSSLTLDPNNGNNSSTTSTTVSPLMRELQVNVTSSNGGGGTVSSSSLTATGIPADISCTGNACSASYPDGTSVKLDASTAWHSTFSGWTGCVSATESCTLLLDANKSVSAAFSIISNPVIIYGNSGYSTLSSALGALHANGSIMALASYSNAIFEALLFNQGHTISLEGGWDDLWSTSAAGLTRVKGTITIKSGRINVKSIRLVP
ncbi:MAG: VCBS repeat-containing protein [Geobacteraceae bacterium]|nr:VCBS repeat-containing protein [Geobacteraceae bacterium]